MKKIFTLFTLLLCVVSTAWADAETVTIDFGQATYTDLVDISLSNSGNTTTSLVDATLGSSATKAYSSVYSIKAASTSFVTKASYNSISAISLYVSTSDKGKTYLTVEICPNADFSSNVTTIQATAVMNGGGLPSNVNNNNQYYKQNYAVQDVTGYVRVTVSEASGSSGKTINVGNIAITYVAGEVKTISTQEFAGVNVAGTAVTKDANENGYSIDGTTITLSNDMFSYIAPTNVTLTNHITYTDETTDDKSVAVTFNGTVTDNYWIGSATIGTIAYTVKVPYAVQSVTDVTINGASISADDLATLTSTKTVTIDGSSLNGIGMIGVTLSGGTTTVTRTFSGNDVTYAFTLNGSDNYSVTLTGVKKTYTAEGSVFSASSDLNANTYTANGVTFTMVNTSKNFQYGSARLNMGEDELVPVKLSTGSAVNVTFPDGKKATKVIVYGWSAEGNGKLYSMKETENGEKSVNVNSDVFYATNVSDSNYPSVYEYELDNWESMYFNPGGSPSQPFVIMDFVFAETQVATPVITPANDSSFSGDTQEVTISCGTEGATVYYTLDGSEPTTSSTVYTDAFNISSTTTVKAFAVKDGLDDSQVATATINKVVSVVTNSWDFTAWSSETKAGVIADTEDWNQYEKANNGGLDFDQNGRSNVSSISSGSSLMYSNTNIAETDGLTFASDAFGLGLIFNLPSATISSTEYTYHGSSYLWLYNKNAVITIPSVPAGATIEIGVESHNGGDARGVTLKNGSTTLTQTDGASTSKVYQVCKWTNATAGNVTVTPSKGIHIYYIKVFSNVETIPVSTKADRSYATCVAEKALDFTEVADEVTAYIATSLNSDNSSVIIEQVTKVPLGEPILVKTATQGATVNVPVIATAEALTANKFAAGDGVTDVTTANDTYYFLKEDMFHKATSGILQKGKAYLKIEGGSNARELSIDFSDGETTGIKNVVNGSKNWFDGEFYNLSGQRVAKPTKGLYIVNGKKIIVK